MTDIFQKLLVALATAAAVAVGSGVVQLIRVDMRIETLEAVFAAGLQERQRNEALQRAKATSLREEINRVAAEAREARHRLELGRGRAFSNTPEARLP